MKDCIGFVIEANKKDTEIKHLNQLNMMETNLYSVLVGISTDTINEIIALMLSGRDKQLFKGLEFNKLLNNYRNEPIVLYSSNDMKIDYIISKRDRLNQYLEVALSNMGE